METVTSGDPRIGLIGTYQTTGTAILLHKPGCSAINMANGKGNMNCGPVSEGDLEDWDERGFKVSICKCAKGAKGAKVMATLGANISALESKQEQLAKAQEKVRELEGEISALKRAIAGELGLNGAAAGAGGGKRGRRSSASTQGELTIVKDAIVKVLKEEKDWTSTMKLSSKVKERVPTAQDSIIARAKAELFKVKEIKRKGDKRGAEYHAN